MPDKIHLLPDSIANQIAAGEVVQRPASVVKELLENSVDAGSKKIQLIVKDAGKTLIQVIDDGTGMSETDARMCFERHATSKISNTNDLFRVRTLGFRGEALASIAAVAQVELRSKLRPAPGLSEEGIELGTLIKVEASETKSQEPVPCSAGTSITVKNLFYNVPARRNFLKSNPVEMRHILDEFQRIAIAYPGLSFTMYQNDMEIFQLASGKLSQRIVSIFGEQYKKQLASCQEKTTLTNITGYIGKPEFTKKTRGEQFFFVNKRFVRHPYLHHAVMNAYEELITKDRFPFYVLFIEIDPKHVDINVHPTKTEIKFDDEKTIYALVRSAVKRSLGVHNITPSIDYSVDVNYKTSTRLVSQQEELNKSDIEYTRQQFRKTPLEYSNLHNWEKLYPGREPEKGGIPARPPSLPESKKRGIGETENSKTKRFTDSPIHRFTDSERNSGGLDLGGAGSRASSSFTLPSAINNDIDVEKDFLSSDESTAFQIHNSYIITQVKSGMMIIDQHAAHQRILYEKYLTMLQNRFGASQQFLFPQTIELSPSDFELVTELKEEIHALGFVFSHFGKNSIVVNGIPADIPPGSEKDLFEGLIEQYKKYKTDLKLETRENLSRSLAKRSAMKHGTKLTAAEMNTVINQLFTCKTPAYTPNGNFTLIILGLDKINEYFCKKK
ncbi:MAG: DNA mismatch repair endonuclease MutL [Bacteroidetes bacterium]|nr:DNA mismatch repair endonuclease MutL [Bacteroidota bacterium]